MWICWCLSFTSWANSLFCGEDLLPVSKYGFHLNQPSIFRGYFHSLFREYGLVIQGISGYLQFVFSFDQFSLLTTLRLGNVRIPCIRTPCSPNPCSRATFFNVKPCFVDPRSRFSGKWCRGSQELSGSYEDCSNLMVVFLMLGGGFKDFYLHPCLWYFSDGLKPPTRIVLLMLHMSHKSQL